jgi:hypothetical protein
MLIVNRPVKSGVKRPIIGPVSDISGLVSDLTCTLSKPTYILSLVIFT